MVELAATIFVAMVVLAVIGELWETFGPPYTDRGPKLDHSKVHAAYVTAFVAASGRPPTPEEAMAEYVPREGSQEHEEANARYRGRVDGEWVLRREAAVAVRPKVLEEP